MLCVLPWICIMIILRCKKLICFTIGYLLIVLTIQLNIHYILLYLLLFVLINWSNQLFIVQICFIAAIYNHLTQVHPIRIETPDFWRLNIIQPAQKERSNSMSSPYYIVRYTTAKEHMMDGRRFDMVPH